MPAPRRNLLDILTCVRSARVMSGRTRAECAPARRNENVSSGTWALPSIRRIWVDFHAGKPSAFTGVRKDSSFSGLRTCNPLYALSVRNRNLALFSSNEGVTLRSSNPRLAAFRAHTSARRSERAHARRRTPTRIAAPRPHVETRTAPVAGRVSSRLGSSRKTHARLPRGTDARIPGHRRVTRRRAPGS